MESGIRIDDGGTIVGKALGARRLKGLLLLSRHPELDEIDWTGRVEFHFGPGGIVKGAVHPAAAELAGF